MKGSEMLHLHTELAKVRRECEKAEVIIRNVLALKRSNEPGFLIPDDDLVVSLETAACLLECAGSL